MSREPRRAAWGPSWTYLAIALGFMAGGLAVALTALPPSSPPVPAPAPREAQAPEPVVPAAPTEPAQQRPFIAVAQVVAAAPALAPPPTLPRQREPGSDPSPDLADYVNPGETPSMGEVIERLRAAGVSGGLAAFSPPGTRPPLVGLAVPEDFALPPGYVRHYQATDDGQRIEPILMYSPDHVFVDAHQRPVALPPDRVVPPEFAPPGLPLRRIVVPAPREPGRPTR